MLADEAHGIQLQVVKHTELKKGFVLLSRRWLEECGFAAGLWERSGMDFISDALWNARRFRSLTIVDDFMRKAAIKVDTSLPKKWVIDVLERLEQEGELPKRIVVVNGLDSPGRCSMPGCPRKASGCNSSSP